MSCRGRDREGAHRALETPVEEQHTAGGLDRVVSGVTAASFVVFVIWLAAGRFGVTRHGDDFVISVQKSEEYEG